MSEITNQSSAPGNAPATPPKKGKAGKIAVAVILVVLLAVIGVLAWYIYNLMSAPKEDTSRIASTSGYVGGISRSDLQSEVDDSRFTTSMNVIWNFANGAVESQDAYVGNLEVNSRDVYIEVVLASDTSDVIYSSPIIPRGQALSQFKLDRVLPVGSYDAICTYHLIDENEETVSELSVQVTINVLS